MELKDIKELIKFLDKSEIMEFEYECENQRVYISKQKGETVFAAPAPAAQTYAAPAVAAPAVSAPAAENNSALAGMSSTAVEVPSPIVGTFYECPAPGAAPFVKEGDVVKKGTTLCIIEAMKIMNEIEAEFDCKIVKKVGVNSKPVEYGETIFIVEPV